jgi:hypothetical protein
VGNNSPSPLRRRSTKHAATGIARRGYSSHSGRRRLRAWRAANDRFKVTSSLGLVPGVGRQEPGADIGWASKVESRSHHPSALSRRGPAPPFVWYSSNHVSLFGPVAATAIPSKSDMAATLRATRFWGLKAKCLARIFHHLTLSSAFAGLITSI